MNKVSVGISTVVGYGTGALAILGSLATGINTSQAQLHGPAKWMGILGVASFVATNAGRQLQAAGLKLRVPSQVSETLRVLPTLEEELASPPPVG